MRTFVRFPLFLSLAAVVGTAACSDDSDDGRLEVVVYGEAFIEEGIPASEMSDGWSVVFDSFQIELGEVTVAEAGAAPALEALAYNTYEIAVPTGGAGLAVAAGDVPNGAYSEVSYRLGTVQVSGTATRDGVEKTFDWTMATETRYSGCEGIAVVDGSTATTQLTIHGDHLFFDDLVSDEPNVAFDLIAQADDQGNADGVIAIDELEAVDITALNRYQVGNLTSVTNLWAFIDAQASLMGHIDGEGHCNNADRD